MSLREEKMGWLEKRKIKRRFKKVEKRTPQEEYIIYKRRLLSGESEQSARAGLKHIKKR